MGLENGYYAKIPLFPSDTETHMVASAEQLYQRHRLSIDDYYKMASSGILSPQDRVELIKGEIIDMPPMGTRHAGILNRLTRIFTLSASQHALISVQTPVRLSEHSEPEPDLSLLKLTDDSYINAHPTPSDVLLAVEIADTSINYDSHVKIPLYAQYGIQEVWLVDIQKRTLYSYRQPDSETKQYRITQIPDLQTEVTPEKLPDASLLLKDLFNGL